MEVDPNIDDDMRSSRVKMRFLGCGLSGGSGSGDGGGSRSRSPSTATSTSNTSSSGISVVTPLRSSSGSTLGGGAASPSSSSPNPKGGGSGNRTPGSSPPAVGGKRRTLSSGLLDYESSSNNNRSVPKLNCSVSTTNLTFNNSPNSLLSGHHHHHPYPNLQHRSSRARSPGASSSSSSAAGHYGHDFRPISTLGPNTGGILNPVVDRSCSLRKMQSGRGPAADVRLRAFTICNDYLYGAWKQIESRDLQLKRISGGLSNYLYRCSLPSNLGPTGNEPTQVLLRFYGQVHGEDALESLITESVIFTLLSERNLGPKLYGVFPGGRIEQFIPARPLQTPELCDPELSLLIAEKAAKIHGLNIPISKEASWLWGTMNRWMSNVKEGFSTPDNPDNSNKMDVINKLISFNLEDEMEWLRKYLPGIGSPVVFSHNDLQEGNILMREVYGSPGEKLCLIDFEYCSYNYRGFDLANHFCEWTYNYNVEKYPNFTFQPQDAPSQEAKLKFIRTYVDVLRREYMENHSEATESLLANSPLFDLEHILKEIRAFTLASHFFWGLWAIVNAKVSKIPFGYWEYGQSRLEEYFRVKGALLSGTDCELKE